MWHATQVIPQWQALGSVGVAQFPQCWKQTNLIVMRWFGLGHLFELMLTTVFVLLVDRIQVWHVAVKDDYKEVTSLDSRTPHSWSKLNAKSVSLAQ